ncbi:preprotein translocase subunit SecE [Williamsia maris]|uniref:Protein translocase subunit SecE n=1 Tax=Williamsia maris TaxID=72806 RepID=A0ABT1HIP3_9NOCA|nr:preprotein translocase subunit SecE [Williamsia maris]
MVSKRDRAARAKGTPEAEATDGVTDAADVLTDETAARPTGKRSSTPRGKRNTAPDSEADTASSVALKERSSRSSTATDQSRNPFIRLWIFLKQVVGELKKVIWPSRSEMVRYTIIVLIFVIVMTAFISGIDLGFAKAVLWLFG